MSIQLTNLTFKREGSSFCLNISNLKVNSGERVFLLGASGSGKSTLLNLLGGILKPSTGNIILGDTDITQLGERDRDRFRARNIGMIFQQFNLIPYLDVEANIRLAVWLGQSGRQPSRNSIAGLIESLGLTARLLKCKANQLSVGQQQRVAIARAVVNRPEFIIADEPTSALDSDAREDFMSLLLDKTKVGGATILFVSHDRSLEKHFSRTLEMNTLNNHGESGDHAI